MNTLRILAAALAASAALRLARQRAQPAADHDCQQTIRLLTWSFTHARTVRGRARVGVRHHARQLAAARDRRQ